MLPLYRDRVHHVAFLRNSLAHLPQPSLTECVAGAAAMVEVLQAYGLSEAADEICQKVVQVKHASWLLCSSEMDLHSEEFLTMVLEAALAKFADVVGSEICGRWQKKWPKEVVPEPPLEVSKVCKILRGDTGKRHSTRGHRQASEAGLLTTTGIGIHYSLLLKLCSELAMT